jgi:hypothetical protein
MNCGLAFSMTVKAHQRLILKLKRGESARRTSVRRYFAGLVAYSAVSRSGSSRLIGAA